MRNKMLFAVFSVLVILAVAVSPVGAITDGELDGNGHPHVVLILMEVNGAPAYRCSGTMIAPTYVLTAGHCAGAPGEFSGMRIFTESDVEAGRGTTNNYPYGGGASIEAVRWAAHPDYPNYPFFYNDVGMIELAPSGSLRNSRNGKLRDIQYIEVHSCPTGCVGGSLTVENQYIARGRVMRTVDKFGGKPCQDREKITALYQKNFFSLPGKIPSVPLQPLDSDVAVALQKLRQKQQFYQHLPKIDCGACGSPTCMTFAEDVVKGNAVADDCVFLAVRKFASISSDLLETVVTHSRRVPDMGEREGDDTQRSG